MKRHIIGTIVAIAQLLLVVACNNGQSTDNALITVSIEPIKGLLEYIVEDDFQINTLLSSGSTPENYSPTMGQIADLEKSEMVFCVGTLPFENELLRSIDRRDSTKIIDLSKGIILQAGQCGHNIHTHSGHHTADPHIWVSLDELSTMVDNIDKELSIRYPDSIKYHSNCQALKADIDRRKARYQQLLTTAPRSILIYHPALGYLAKTLSLNQIALEIEGKNPTPAALIEIAERVDAEGIDIMLYQREYPYEIVKPIADILGVKLVEFNPLCSNILDEMDRVINIISGVNEQ